MLLFSRQLQRGIWGLGAGQLGLGFLTPCLLSNISWHCLPARLAVLSHEPQPELARLAASSASPSRVLNHSGAEQTSWEQLSLILCGLSCSCSIVCSVFSKHHHQSMTGCMLELASLPSAGRDENQLCWEPAWGRSVSKWTLVADEQAKEKAAAAARASLLRVVFTSSPNFLPRAAFSVDGLMGFCLPHELLILCPPATSSGLSTKTSSSQHKGWG